MTAETSLYSILDANAGLAAIVGERIYPDLLPEGATFPAVVFTRSKTDPVYGLSGAAFGADVSLTVAAWGSTRTSADAAADAIVAALAGSGFIYSGRESAVDPESGLFASTLSFSFFEP